MAVKKAPTCDGHERVSTSDTVPEVGTNCFISYHHPCMKDCPPEMALV